MPSGDDLNTYHRLLGDLFDRADRVVAFTGAGISTESGIPDFRSPGGLWTKRRIIDYDEFIASPQARLEDWQRRFEMEDQLGAVAPNVGHYALANLVEAGKITHVVTQNVDALHQRSGIPDDKVIELHGNSTYAKCLTCGLVHTIAAIRAEIERKPEAPACVSCGGIVKSAVISFGEQMPQEAMLRAQRAALGADLFLAIGSSLVVYPAAGIPLMAKQNGAELLILNRDPTELDSYADYVVNRSIGEVLSPFAKPENRQN